MADSEELKILIRDAVTREYEKLKKRIKKLRRTLCKVQSVLCRTGIQRKRTRNVCTKNLWKINDT